MEVLNEIEIEALPADFPEKIEVDLAKLETIESQITIADLVIDKNLLEIKNAPDQVIVKAEEPRAEEEPVVTEEVAPGDVPATEQKSPEETAEGETKATEVNEKADSKSD